MSTPKKAAASEKLGFTKGVSIFVCFFLVFGYVGYSQGEKEKTDPQSFHELVEERLSTNRNSSGIVFSYQCLGTDITYDIDTNSPHDASFITNPQPATPPPNGITAMFSDDRVVSALIGGASAWIVKAVSEVIDVSKPIGENVSKVTRAGLAIAGSIFGFQTGYYAAKGQTIPCNDDKVKERLKDAATWLDLEGPKWAQKYREVSTQYDRFVKCTFLNKGYNGSIPSEVKAIEAKLSQIQDRVSVVKHDFNTQDFDELDGIKADIDSIARSYIIYTDFSCYLLGATTS